MSLQRKVSMLHIPPGLSQRPLPEHHMHPMARDPKGSDCIKQLHPGVC